MLVDPSPTATQGINLDTLGLQQPISEPSPTASPRSPLKRSSNAATILAEQNEVRRRIPPTEEDQPFDNIRPPVANLPAANRNGEVSQRDGGSALNADWAELNRLLAEAAAIAHRAGLSHDGQSSGDA